MGNKQPQNEIPKLRKSELEEFSKQSLLLPSVIERLYNHFYRISRIHSADGVIDMSEFCFTIKKHETSLLIERIFHMFDTNSDKVINFREFILGISTFSDNQDLLIRENSAIAAIRMKEKIDYSIRIYDLKSAKKVYQSDLLEILSSVIKEKAFSNLTKKQVKSIVRRTMKIEICQEDEFGKYWDSETYAKMVMKNPQIFKWIAVDIEAIKHEIKLGRNVAKCFSLY